MRFLLDTHCWLWMRAEPDRFSPASRRLLCDPETHLLFSAASAWEIAVKHALGKLRLPQAPSVFVAERLAQDQIEALPIEISHALRAGELPAHHRDPFDRLLVAQAQIEKLTLLTSDRQLESYGVAIHWAGAEAE